MDDVLEKAEEYKTNAGRLRLGHYIAAEKASRMNKALGIPSVVVSAIVATSIFSTMSEDVDIMWRISTGIIALVAAVLVSLQTFLNYDDLAERHHKSAARYYNVARRLDIFYLHYHDKDDSLKDTAITELREITETLAELSSDSPSLTEKVFAAAVHRKSCEQELEERSRSHTS
ncbi:MAG: SLATT domain-containing protein [Planctomycetes bacterium]|nr:SLATT domain-containing protein [Planctomycetota bacterium]